MYFPGPWDAVVAPVAEFFATPGLRRGPEAQNVLVYGPPHLFRSAWLAGAFDYLKDPWTVEELYLRLKGPRPVWLEWTWANTRWRLTDLSVDGPAGGRCDLSAAEAEILRILIQRQGTVVSRNVLCWVASCSGARVVDTLVGRIRQKIRNLAGVTEDPIPAVRGHGYRLP